MRLEVPDTLAVSYTATPFWQHLPGEHHVLDWDTRTMWLPVLGPTSWCLLETLVREQHDTFDRTELARRHGVKLDAFMKTVNRLDTFRVIRVAATMVHVALVLPTPAARSRRTMAVA